MLKPHITAGRKKKALVVPYKKGVDAKEVSIRVRGVRTLYAQGGVGPRKLQNFLFTSFQRQLSHEGTILGATSERMLVESLSDAAQYVNTSAKPLNEAVKAREALHELGRRLTGSGERRVSAIVMQQMMKRWLPCPPFCKNSALQFVRKDSKYARKLSSRKTQKGL